MITERDGESPRLAQRLRDARQRTFVGRSEELELFRKALDDPAAPVRLLYLHGPGGIGKSTLVHRFGDEARAAGRPVLHLDGRAIGPTPAAFAAAASGAVTSPGVVLMIDTFEHCQGLEGWLREQFLRHLPPGSLAVLAGRCKPDPRWTDDPAWQGRCEVLRVRALSPSDALALITRHGVTPALHQSVLSFAGGHPLALRLASEVAVAQDVAGTASWRSADDLGADSWQPTHDVVETLLAQLVGELPSPAHRHALEVCSHALTTTEPLLRTALGEEAGSLFGWLRELPYIETGPHGIFPHEVVRDALNEDLRWRDPEGYATMHRLIRGHLIERAMEATGPEMLPAMADLIYLQRHASVMPKYFTWQGHGQAFEDGYRPGDRDTVLALAADAEGPESAAIAEFWLSRQPDAFRVYRRPETTAPVAFMAWLRLDRPDPDQVRIDPVVAAAWNHCAEIGPLRAGEHLSLARFMVHPPLYQRPSPITDLMQMRMLAQFLHERGLAMHFIVVRDAEFWTPHMDYFDDHRVAEVPTVGGLPHHLFAHDWRTAPLVQWLAHNERQVLFGPQPRPAVAGAPSLTVLSRPEFDTAVRDALRAWHQPVRLAANPLARSRLVAERPAEDPATALREILTAALDSLRDSNRTARLHRVLVVTFLHGAPTQNDAAERLGLPFSTYRRHLTRAVDAVCAHLWERELRG